MNKQQAIAKACQVIRKRVRFKTASLSLDKNNPFRDDTAQIREATRIYVESWIVPLLDAIESGDMRIIKEFYQKEPGDPMSAISKITHDPLTTP